MKFVLIICVVVYLSIACDGVRLKRQVPPQLLPTFDDGCGQMVQPIVKRAIGGQAAPKQSWPWIALLVYDKAGVKDFRCSGTVITRRHVLTAAQCIQRDLVSVRLGEYDINNQTESQHVDINIKKAVKHPSFNRKKAGRNDIAVLYLEEEIQYNEYIKPICLPISIYRNDNLVGYEPFFAGWGATDADEQELSPVLQQVQINIYENKICDTFYKHQHRLAEEDTIDEAFICAGDFARGKGPCAGDAGGPLVVAHHIPGEGYRLILVGVVSAGVKCGSKDAPSLFTRTSYYIDWIQEQCSKEV